MAGWSTLVCHVGAGCLGDGAGILERIYGCLNSVQYLHILENVFLPTTLEHYPEEPILFQQDDLCAHSAGRSSLVRWEI